MDIDEKTLLHIAKTARLNLTKTEINEFLPQLNEVMKNFEELSKVNTKDIMPSIHPVPIIGKTKEDKIGKCLSEKDALLNTKHKKDSYFKGPKII